MHRGENHVAHARIRSHLADEFAVKVFRSKTGRERFVFVEGNLLAIPYPLATLQQAVETIMNQKPVTGLGEPVCSHR